MENFNSNCSGLIGLEQRNSTESIMDDLGMAMNDITADLEFIHCCKLTTLVFHQFLIAAPN